MKRRGEILLECGAKSEKSTPGCSGMDGNQVKLSVAFKGVGKGKRIAGPGSERALNAVFNGLDFTL